MGSRPAGRCLPFSAASYSCVRTSDPSLRHPHLLHQVDLLVIDLAPCSLRAKTVGNAVGCPTIFWCLFSYCPHYLSLNSSFSRLGRYQKTLFFVRSPQLYLAMTVQYAHPLVSRGFVCSAASVLRRKLIVEREMRNGFEGYGCLPLRSL